MQDVEEDDLSTETNLPGLPKSVYTMSLECCVVVMTALGNNYPINAPKGTCSKRCLAVIAKLAGYSSPAFPNGMNATLKNI